MSVSLDREACAARDATDPLGGVRRRFALPDGVIYLDGNSLGALPAATRERISEVVDGEWGRGLIGSWSTAGWMEAPQRVGDKIARLIGAAPGEVVVGDSTTVCLFKLLSAALEMSGPRQVLLTEEENFHTDRYVAGAAARLHGGVLRMVPRDRLLDALDSDVAALTLTHIDFRTGEMHDMAAVSAAAHGAGALTVWDLSHSAGAVPLSIDADGADMAAGCGYKYLNGGPGAPAYMHVRSDLHSRLRNPVPGWLGHAEPFAFEAEYRSAPGMLSMLSGTPPVLQLTALESSVDLWLEVSVHEARAKSVELCELFIELVESRCTGMGFALISPRDASRRGSQVSLQHADGYGIVRSLAERGVIGDFRAPDVCRFGFAPLYLRYVDVWDAVEHLVEVMRSGSHRHPRFAQRGSIT